MAVLDDGDLIADRYRITRRLGAGGMASVYECVDEGSGERVALKILHDHLLMDQPQIVERFRREARMMVRLSQPEPHPHVVAVRQLIARQDLLAIVMELVEGGAALDALLARRGPLGEAEAVGLVVAILDGLAFIHDHGIVHRDLKPSNILITRGPDGAVVPKLSDFGIAKDLGGPDDLVETLTALTQTENAFGSPAYMAPELFDSAAEASVRSDLYALGVCLFEMLTGTVPFVVDSMPSHVMRISTQPAPSVRAQRPEVSRDVERAIGIALAKDPTERFESAASFADVLQGGGEHLHGAGDLTSITSDYRVDERIGRGPVATVYACTDVNLQVPVAVKLLRSADPGRQARFIGEAKAQAALHQGRVHVGIAAIRHIIASAEHHALVVERVAGEPLDRYLEQHPLNLAAVTQVFIDLADALSFAHERGIIHRNLKPTNVLIGAPTDAHGPHPVKLTDFCMDAIVSRGRIERCRQQGSIPYLAPELVDDEAAATVASDLFALGALMVQALTGTRPPSVAEAARRGDAGARNAAQRAIPALPGNLARTLNRCLATDPAERPASAAEVREALEDDLSMLSSVTVAPVVGEAARASRNAPLIIALVGVLLLALGAVGYFLFVDQEARVEGGEADAQPSAQDFQRQVDEQVFAASQGQVDVCLSELVSDPAAIERISALEHPTVTIRLAIHLAADGRVERVEVTEDTLPGAGLSECIAELARGWTYPAPGRERVIKKPWIFPFRQSD